MTLIDIDVVADECVSWRDDGSRSSSSDDCSLTSTDSWSSSSSSLGEVQWTLNMSID